MIPRELRRAYVHASTQHALGSRVQAALEASRPRPEGPACVIAIGKAAAAMAEGALAGFSALGVAVDEALVVLPHDTDASSLATTAPRSGARLVLRRASHPLPDESSVRAGRACLALARRAETKLLCVLVSGGASSLVALPAPGVTLPLKRSVTRALLASGADIRQVNLVRAHLSAIKGGRLLAASRARRVLTLVASDVVSGDLADVGSGPTISSPSRPRDARVVLRTFAPAFASLPLARARVGGPPSRTRLVASPQSFARTMAHVLRSLGYEVRLLPASTASVETLARSYVRLAAGAAPKTAFVRAAEPSLVVPRRAGRGGRSTHLAALVGAELATGSVFGAFATDGVDGASDTAGAVVDSRFPVRVRRALGDGALADALRRFDTGPLHRAAETALPSRPSGQNYADLHVLVVG